MKNNKEIVMNAVKHDGRALEFTHKELKNDVDVVFEAYK